jgi:hypothetical protein
MRQRLNIRCPHQWINTVLFAIGIFFPIFSQYKNAPYKVGGIFELVNPFIGRVTPQAFYAGLGVFLKKVNISLWEWDA